jgi:hypothetical protein
LDGDETYGGIFGGGGCREGEGRDIGSVIVSTDLKVFGGAGGEVGDTYCGMELEEVGI